MTEQIPPTFTGPKRVLSGVQPTGALHLGNYLGALVKFTRMQHEMETFIFVADLHAITQWQDPKLLKSQVREIAAAYLASGLDPKVATIFPQSAVPAHAEMIIEGYLSTSVFEPRLGFGEYPGFISKEPSTRPIITVTGITHRRNPLFTAVLVGYPPSDNNTLSAFVNSAMVYHTLRYEAGLPLDDAYFYETSGGADFGVLRLARSRLAGQPGP